MKGLDLTTFFGSRGRFGAHVVWIWESLPTLLQAWNLMILASLQKDKRLE